MIDLNKLRAEIAVLESDYAKSKEVESVLGASYDEQSDLRDIINSYDYTCAVIKESKKIINNYIKTKEQNLELLLNLVIVKARNVIENSSNVAVKRTDKGITFATMKGNELSLSEGSALRSTLTTICRVELLKQMDKIPFIILDEPLATLNDKSTMEFGNILNAYSDVKFCLIEQKPSIATNVTDKGTYLVELLGDNSTVRRIV